MAVQDGVTGAPPRRSVGAIVVAAGESRRMAGVDKIFVPLAGRPLVSYSLEVLQSAPFVDAIVLVLSADGLDQGRRLADANSWHKVKEICAGGERRQDSVRKGLERLPDSQWVVVQDGARPFIDADLIARGLEEAKVTGAAVAAVRVKDTIKSANSQGLVTRTLRRDRLWAVQTPQVFRRNLLADAHERITADVTDDAAMVEAMGGKIKIFMGSHQNFKITTPDDLSMAEAILRARMTVGGLGGGR